jgi:hypothetical protein
MTMKELIGCEGWENAGGFKLGTIALKNPGPEEDRGDHKSADNRWIQDCASRIGAERCKHLSVVK